MDKGCQFGHWMFGCRQPATGCCQYCGRRFCLRHGQHLPDGQQICLAWRCQAKFEDLTVFRSYREEVRERNERGLCGVEGCARDIWGQCSKCEGLFCARHLSRHDEAYREGRRILRRPLSTCGYCTRRLELWAP